MPLVLFALVAAGAYKFYSYDRQARQAVAIRAASYQHPALKPTRLQSPEFYRSLYWK
jgi:hypothetical protein